MNTRLRKMIIGALLIALAIVIPIQFGFLKIYLPPFSATLASHVPLLIAMFISPRIAAAVGAGSTVGFFMAGMPGDVVARAATHIIVGYVAGKIIQKDKNYKKAIIMTAPLHGILEALVVIPFGFSAYQILVGIALGATIHHCVDGAIAASLAQAIAKVNRKELYSFFSGSKEVNEKIDIQGEVVG